MESGNVELPAKVFTKKMADLRQEIAEELEELELELKQARYARRRAFAIWLVEKPKHNKRPLPATLAALLPVIWASGPLQTYLEFAAAIALMRSFIALEQGYEEEVDDGFIAPFFPPSSGFSM